MKTWKERQTFFDREVDLYPVVSSPFCAGRSVTEVLEGIAAGGAKIVQIREKDMSGQKLFELVTACKRITDRAGMLLIVDDHTDVALAADADGVHLGQDDLPVAAAKKNRTGTAHRLLHT